MRRTWGNLGGQLGLGLIAIGILLIGLAWNGAAGVDFDAEFYPGRHGFALEGGPGYQPRAARLHWRRPGQPCE